MTAFVALSSLFLVPITFVSIVLDLVSVSFLGLPEGAYFRSAISGYLMAGHRCDEVYVRSSLLSLGSRYMRITFNDSVREGCIIS
jgi:hypothetical protein